MLYYYYIVFSDVFEYKSNYFKSSKNILLNDMTFTVRYSFNVQTGSVAPDGAVEEAHFHHISVAAEANKPGHQSTAETTPTSNHNHHLGRTLHGETLTMLNKSLRFKVRRNLIIFFPFSQTPSSGFWKELALAMPRKVTFHRESAGDPQTLLQGDKDPMLTQQPDYLDCRPDPDPAGDLGTKPAA